jgi:hypothetical protein
MGDNLLDEAINKCIQKLTEIVSEMDQLKEAYDILSVKIEDADNNLDDLGNDPTGVEQPSLAEQYKYDLLKKIEIVAEKYIELQNIQTKLINVLESLPNRMSGGKKNKTLKKQPVKKRRQKRSYNFTRLKCKRFKK